MAARELTDEEKTDPSRPPGANAIDGRAWLFRSDFAPVIPPSETRPPKDDFELKEERVAADTGTEGQDTLRRKQRQHLVRTVTYDVPVRGGGTETRSFHVAHHEQFGFNWVFPCTITMQCGNETNIQEVTEIQGTRLKCPCADEYCYFIDGEVE